MSAKPEGGIGKPLTTITKGLLEELEGALAPTNFRALTKGDTLAAVNDKLTTQVEVAALENLMHAEGPESPES